MEVGIDFVYGDNAGQTYDALLGIYPPDCQRRTESRKQQAQEFED